MANRIRTAEAEVKALVEGYNEDDEDHVPHSPHDVEVGHDDGSDDDDRHSIDEDEKFRELEEEVATLVADVHDLALYSKLNFTGFMKIDKVLFYVVPPLKRSCSFFQKHEVRSALSPLRLNLGSIPIETDWLYPQDQFLARVFGQTAFLQVQLGRHNRQAIETV